MQCQAAGKTHTQKKHAPPSRDRHTKQVGVEIGRTGFLFPSAIKPDRLFASTNLHSINHLQKRVLHTSGSGRRPLLGLSIHARHHRPTCRPVPEERECRTRNGGWRGEGLGGWMDGREAGLGQSRTGWRGPGHLQTHLTHLPIFHPPWCVPAASGSSWPDGDGGRETGISTSALPISNLKPGRCRYVITTPGGKR